MAHTSMPISRDSMRILHAHTLEEQRKDQIHMIVTQIYRNTLSTAKNTNNVRHLYGLPGIATPLLEFHRINMLEILAEVQSLFPDCSVDHTTLTMATAIDGKLYDISKIDETLKPLIRNPGRSMEYIVVDWS